MRGYISQNDTLNLNSIRNGTSRVIVPIYSGFVEGSGLKAEITPGGADWISLDTKLNIAHIDVRTQARTSDGGALHIYYQGVLKMDDAATKVLGWAKDAKTTQFGDHNWFNAPIIETSSEEFKWVESTLFVGEGRFIVDEKGSAVEYQIFKVVN